MAEQDDRECPTCGGDWPLILEAIDDFAVSAVKLGQLRASAAQEFVRLAAIAGAKANTFLIQKQVDAEYIEQITKAEALLEVNRVLMEVAARNANESD